MVGIFQIFGISFLFWTFVGCLRFIFETLERLRTLSRVRSFANLVFACVGGLGVTGLLLFLFFSKFGLFEVTPEESLAFAFAAFPLWVMAIVVGSYVASRIYVHEPQVIGGVVSLGAVAIGTATFFNLSTGNLLSSEHYLGWNIWIIFTICSGLIGSNLAQNVNQIEEKGAAKRRAVARKARIRPEEIAIVTAAHNEELTIGSTLQSLLKFADPKNIYVASDGSKDKTVEVAKKYGVHVEDIQPNRGKAGALTYALEQYHILENYKAVLFIDADNKADANFYKYALPQLDDPAVVAVVGHAVPLWPKHYIPQWRLFFTAYRIRLWLVLQFCLRYGQTWKYTNVSPIVPGGGSIYRTSALRHIRIDTPGLIIEDFNMTFSIHHQQLGKISFDSAAYMVDQEPFSLRDYTRQIYRWYMGFFQTVRHHGLWLSWFCFFTTFFTVEMFVSSLLFILTPLIALGLIVTGIDSAILGIGWWRIEITLIGIITALLILDYIVTIIAAIIERKPLLLIYGFGFILLRYVEASVFLYALVKGLLHPSRHDGAWKSPQRISYSIKEV